MNIKFNNIKRIFSPADTEDGIYSIILLAALIVFLTLLIRFVSIGNVSVSEIDEVPYFNSSKAFAEQLSVKSTGVVEEESSVLTESDWYGPAYPLFFGTFRILLGNSDKAFIYTNILLILLAVLLISKTKLPVKDKKWLVLILLLCPSFFSYQFIYMPVILDLALASALILILVRIGSAFNKQDIKYMAFLYLFCVLVAAMFKQNFIFFSFGIIVFSKNWKWLILWLICIALLFVSVMTYNKYFLAPVYIKNYKESIDLLAQFRILEFFRQIKNSFILNLLEFKSKRPAPLVYVVPFYMVLLPFLVILLNYKENNKILFSICIIAFTTFTSYLIFYTTGWYYFIRISIPLVFLSSVSILFLQNRSKIILKFLILFLIVLSLPLTVIEIIKNQDIKKRNYDYVNYEMPDFDQITSFLDKNKINTILIDPDFYKIYGFEQFLVALPIETDNNIIRYTVNYRLKNKFELLHKLKVDYVLTPKAEDIPNTTIINKTDYYYLYKFMD